MDSGIETTTAELISGNHHLPLDPFFAVLKKNRFSVTTLQIIQANKVIIQYANRVKNETELCLYLSPIFSASEDEQKLFKELFDKYINDDPFSSTEDAALKPGLEVRIKKNWKKLLALYSFLSLLIVFIIIFTVNNRTEIDPSMIKVFLLDKKDNGDIFNNKEPLKTIAGEKLEVSPTYKYPEKKTSFTLSARYDWGDHSVIDESSSHIYLFPGNYILVSYIAVVADHADTIKTDIQYRQVIVCSAALSLSVITNAKDSVAIGKKIMLHALINAKAPPDYIMWNEDEITFNSGKELQISFPKPGPHTITCTAVYGDFNSACTIKKDITLIAYDPNDHNKPVVKNTLNEQKATAPPIKEKVDPILYYLYAVLFLVFLFLAIFFFLKWFTEMNRKDILKTAVLEKYTKLTTSFSKKAIPKVLPFKNKNYIPVYESELTVVARRMRKRVDDNISFLHVENTIKKSIRNGGMFQPVNAVRTRQSEYLILIDETTTNSQQVKLFEYLVDVLRKQNVLVDKYYYRKEPKNCYNINEPEGISLEKLNAKYKNHTLLIFGNAYQFISHDSPIFDNEYLEILYHWQYKAVVTPVSFSDWKTKEKNILLEHIPLFPVDIEGIILLIELMFHQESGHDIIARLKQSGHFYRSQEIDFTNIDELLKYCDHSKQTSVVENKKQVNVFFQWVAALAIYPKIRWEIIIAFGKSIFDKYNIPEELNFTNLLRLVRISWINTGIFPENIRLELLKRLTPENERIVRETMLMLLKEIPVNEEERFIDQEKEVQQIINEFTLYARDPIFYSSYRESKYMFEKLWEEKKIDESPLEVYLKNPAVAWKTLINSENKNNYGQKNVGVEEYLEMKQEEETILSKTYLWLGIISVIVAVSTAFALRVLYVWDYIL